MLFGESGHVCCWLLTTCFNCSNSNRDEILSPSHLQKTFEVPGVPFITFVLLKKKKKEKTLPEAQRAQKLIQWLALVANLATRWPICISWKFDHQMAPHGLIVNLATRWRHLHKLHIWPPSGTTWIGSTFGHQSFHLHCLQSWPPGCVTALPHCLGLPFLHYQLVLSWYLHQPESHQLSLHKVA